MSAPSARARALGCALRRLCAAALRLGSAPRRAAPPRGRPPSQRAPTAHPTPARPGPPRAQVLQLEPPPVTTQYASGPQPAVGSHRLWAADIVAQLLSLRNTAVTAALADTSLVPRVVAIALRHDKCSAVHARALQLVRTAVQHKLNGVWQPLFEPGFGAGLAGNGARRPPPRPARPAPLQLPLLPAPAVGGSSRRSALTPPSPRPQPALTPPPPRPPRADGEQLRPLHLELVSVGAAAAGQPVGSRSGLVGMAVQMLRDLRAAAAAEPRGAQNKRLAELLQVGRGWGCRRRRRCRWS